MNDHLTAGRADGKAAASWVFDGNTDRETYAYVLRGIEDGDPAVLDALPQPAEAEAPDDDPRDDDYDLDFQQGRDDELTRVARYMLTDDDA